MDPRGVAETVGAALVSSALAAVGLWLFAGVVNWPLVAGVGVVVALASAAAYRDRTTHADLVEDSGDDGPSRRGGDGAAGPPRSEHDPPARDEAARPPDSDR
ncbi:hypothetical protein ACFQGE_08235 [Halomicroarcula sp. GCM10025817]|uniref:hypothetical protein n=1 Tax=Haloarcula TaxID=2237 RepID=UPI0023E789CD|nr:hypothetical protein [Halomicroarcula sp. SYNS111]